MINNTAEIRRQNTKKIVSYLRSSEPITKKSLAEVLGLSFATISNICNDLLGDKILEQNSSMSSGGGRIPDLISLNPNSKHYLCLNLMQKEILELSLLDFKCKVVDMRKLEMKVNYSFDELLAEACKFKAELLEGKNINEHDIIGVGVSISGIYDKKTQLFVHSNNPIYKEQPIKQKIVNAFDLPVIVENDSNLLVLAASDYFRNGRKNNDAVYLYLGEGLGTGIISEGKIISGRDGLGGDISHLPLGNRNFQCYCGNRGCIETELSLKGFLRKYQEEAGIQYSYTMNDWNDFVRKVHSGDKNALNVVAENGNLFGKLIASMIGIFGTEDIFIGGITKDIFDYLKPHITDEVKKRVMISYTANINLLNSVDFKNLIFRGCGELLFNEWVP